MIKRPRIHLPTSLDSSDLTVITIFLFIFTGRPRGNELRTLVLHASHHIPTPQALTHHHQILPSLRLSHDKSVTA